MGVTGIILAGGKSTRMGADKGLVLLGGMTLAGRMIEKLHAICDQVLISTNSDAYRDLKVETVPDHFREIGPMGGIHASLKASRNDLNLVLSVDLPFVNHGLLDYLIEKAEGYQISAPWSGGEHYEPLCACYHRSILPILEIYISRKNYKMPDVFRTVAFNPLRITEHLPFYHPYLFFNTNSAEELRQAEKLIRYADEGNG